MYSIAKFRVKIRQNLQENLVKYRKVANAEQQMEGFGKVIEGEVSKSFS